MSLLGGFIDLLFPPRCLVCHTFTDSGSICHLCSGDFTHIRAPLCPICGTPFRSGLEENRVCEGCLRKRPAFDQAAAPYLYQGQLMRAIHGFKYEGKAHLADVLGPLLASFAEAWLPARFGMVVMPVPLHPRRLRERGFNQSLLLARHAAARLNAEVDFLSLRRMRDTKPQMELKVDQRRRNVRRAFVMLGSKPWTDKTVILVDDVATTGSTLHECARVLKKAGCKQVYGLVLARTAMG